MPPTNPADEIVTIVDRNDRPIGAVSRRIMRQQGLIHRASYILVFNTRGELFVQKRTMSKDVYPGYWDVAAGGVVLADERYEESARRELREELQVSGAALTPLFAHYHEEGNNRVWGRVFSCIHDGPFILQAEEIEDGRFMSLEEVEQLGQTEPVTPDGLAIIRRLRRPRA